MADSSDKIDFKIVYRDDYKPMIKHFLTGTSELIPKLVVLNPDRDVLYTWGARPAEAQKIMDDFKAGKIDKEQEEVYEDLQKWYSKDMGVSAQKEIVKGLGEVIG